MLLFYAHPVAQIFQFLCQLHYANDSRYDATSTTAGFSQGQMTRSIEDTRMERRVE